MKTIPRYPRWANKLYADLNGYFWTDCPNCGTMFGGHEIGSGRIYTSEWIKCESTIEHSVNGILVSSKPSGAKASHRSGKCLCWKCDGIIIDPYAPNLPPLTPQ